MGHDGYGKKVLEEATEGNFKNWFQWAKRSFKYRTGGIIADQDGVIGDDCVVEVTAVTGKQIRGGILDLVFHPRLLKLLVVMPVYCKDFREEDYQSLMDCLIKAHCPGGLGRVVVLKGSGHDPQTYFREDCEIVKRAVSSLLRRGSESC